MNAGGGTDGRLYFGGGGDSRMLITKAGVDTDGYLRTPTGAGDIGSLYFEAGGAGGT